MGRFLSKLWNGVKKAGRWIGNAAGKVSNVAGVLSNVPVIGGFASTVARGANPLVDCLLVERELWTRRYRCSWRCMRVAMCC